MTGVSCQGASELVRHYSLYFILAPSNFLFTYLAVVWGAVWLGGEQSKIVRDRNWKGEHGESGRENVFKPSLLETSLSVQNASKTFGGRASPGPTSFSGLLDAVRASDGNTL